MSDDVIALAARHGFQPSWAHKSELLVRRVLRGPKRLVGRWLVISDAEDSAALPPSTNSETMLSVYLHDEETGGPAIEDGPLSDHYYENLPAALVAVDALLSGLR